ncbi:MAG: hypothetical protein DMG13_04220 [Acidobacteria bacterium]|nr:MAG: hypothetical protein DMG13_04220 [Acidobacteriota bacterium]
MIGGVESLEPKLQVPALGEVEILQRREIPSDDSGAGEHIAADVAERAQGLQGEGLDVEPGNPILAFRITSSPNPAAPDLH